jgi:hypothetical protein
MMREWTLRSLKPSRNTIGSQKNSKMTIRSRRKKLNGNDRGRPVIWLGKSKEKS